MLSGDDSLVVSDDETQPVAEKNGKKVSADKGDTSEWKSELMLEDTEEVDLNGGEARASAVPPSRLRLHDDSSSSQQSHIPTAPSPVPAEDPNQVLDIRIEDFEKRGDGINAYLVYRLVSRVENVPGLQNKVYEVWRRFSDFLGLHEKLTSKLLSKGVLLPPPPEKSISVMTKTKTSSGQDQQNSAQFAERRRRALERFIRRLSLHPRVRADCDFRDFISLEATLPKASNTAALSSAGVKRIFKSVGDVFTKMAFHMEESDRWFEHTQAQVEELDEALRRVASLAEAQAAVRRELAVGGEALARALSLLASCEENTALARALSHLTDTQDAVATAHHAQADADLQGIAEYVGLVGSLKELFAERVRVWQNWQTAQQTLSRKRELKARQELAGKAAAVKEEMDEAVEKMDQLEKDFGELSKQIRDEFVRFEEGRKKDLKKLLIAYLESLVATQHKLLQCWEKFAPETQSILAL